MMIAAPLVSVVIPAYNAEQTIVPCLDSVRLQTYADLEILVVDDGSTDRTTEVLETYRQQYSSLRLRILSQRNAGPSAARNHGIAAAQGEYIAFLDADDRWREDKIERQLAVFRSDDRIGLVGGLVSVGNAIDDNDEDNRVQAIGLRKLLFRNYFMTSAVVCKRDMLSVVRFDVSQKYAEDYRLWLEMAAEGVRCVVVQQHVTIMNDKPMFGASGLSARLWKMERGELGNFYLLKTKKRIGTFAYGCACTYSFLKFLRRFCITGLRKIKSEH